MARKAGGNAWQWSRTAETRQVLLDAAREVFCEQGFHDAGVAQVVSRAGSSVGSLYHHFGGKTELFMALWEQDRAAHEHAAAAAVAKASAEGEQDPLNLFAVGAQAFLEYAWRRRDLARLFLGGDAPPGFELIRRDCEKQWVRQNAVLLDASSNAVDRLTVSVLTAVIAEACREVTTAATKQEANRIVDAALTLIRRLDPLDLSEHASTSRP
jgi:AcrR family transcriptional regulator